MSNRKVIVATVLALSLPMVGGAVLVGYLVVSARRTLGEERSPLVIAPAPAVQAFTEKLVADLHAARGVHDQLDWETLGTRGLPDDYPVRRLPAHLANLRRDDIAAQFFFGLESRIQEGGSVQFQGTALRDAQTVARIRVLPIGGGVEFLDLLVAEQSTGLRVVDAFVLTQGRWLSESMSETHTQFQGESTATKAAAREALLGMGAAMQEGDGERALGYYASLPAGARGNRALSTLRVTAAALLDPGDPRYLAIVEEHAAAFPDDLSSEVWLFDVHLANQNWDAARLSNDVMQAEFPDPYWETSHARIDVLSGQAEAGLRRVQAALEEEPDLFDGHDVALLASLALGDMELAREYAIELEGQFGVELDVLATHPGYERLNELLVAPVND